MKRTILLYMFATLTFLGTAHGGYKKGVVVVTRGPEPAQTKAGEESTIDLQVRFEDSDSHRVEEPDSWITHYSWRVSDSYWWSHYDPMLPNNPTKTFLSTAADPFYFGDDATTVSVELNFKPTKEGFWETLPRAKMWEGVRQTGVEAFLINSENGNRVRTESFAVTPSDIIAADAAHSNRVAKASANQTLKLVYKTNKITVEPTQSDGVKLKIETVDDEGAKTRSATLVVTKDSSEAWAHGDPRWVSTHITDRDNEQTTWTGTYDSVDPSETVHVLAGGATEDINIAFVASDAKEVAFKLKDEVENSCINKIGDVVRKLGMGDLEVAMEASMKAGIENVDKYASPDIATKYALAGDLLITGKAKADVPVPLGVANLIPGLSIKTRGEVEAKAGVKDANIAYDPSKESPVSINGGNLSASVDVGVGIVLEQDVGVISFEGSVLAKSGLSADGSFEMSTAGTELRFKGKSNVGGLRLKPSVSVLYQTNTLTTYETEFELIEPYEVPLDFAVMSMGTN